MVLTVSCVVWQLGTWTVVSVETVSGCSLNVWNILSEAMAIVSVGWVDLWLRYRPSFASNDCALWFLVLLGEVVLREVLLGEIVLCEIVLVECHCFLSQAW